MKSAIKIAVVLSLILSLVACSVFTPNTATQPSTQNEDTQTQISAGFTDDEEVPFIILHPSGEQLGVTQDVKSKEKTGVVWTSPEGNAVVIYADKDGNPKGAVIGDDILLYSNYSENTIDITILHPDGTSEVFTNLEIDTRLINKVKNTSSASSNLVSFSNQNNLLQTQEEDFWDFMDYAWITVGVASCLSAFILGTGAGAVAGAPAGGAGAVPGATVGAIATFVLLASLCGGVIIDVVIKTAEIHNIDVTPLKAVTFVKNFSNCKKRKMLDWQSCGKTLTTILKTLMQVADKKVSSNSEAKVIFDIFPNSSTSGCDNLNLTPEECANSWEQSQHFSLNCETVEEHGGVSCECASYEDIAVGVDFSGGIARPFMGDNYHRVAPNKWVADLDDTDGNNHYHYELTFYEDGHHITETYIYDGNNGYGAGGCQEEIDIKIIK